MAVTYSDADNVLRWTAERLLADDQPAYGSIHQGDDPPEPPTRKGTAYTLPPAAMCWTGAKPVLVAVTEPPPNG